MRCPRCGNENPETNRFCGMCGASLLQAPSPAQAGASSVSSTVTRAATTVASAVPVAAPAQTAPPGVPSSVRSATAAPASPAPRAPALPPEPSPIISGPSFLGLNQPAPAPRRSGPLSIDPHAGPSSGSLDYLLEDEEPKRSGAWKLILIVIALALAAGFGYLRWKEQGLPWLGSSVKKPSPTAQSAGAPDAGASSSQTSPSPTSSATSTEAPASSPPAAGTSPGAPEAVAATPPANTSASAALSSAQPSTQPPPSAADTSGGASSGSAAAPPPAANDATSAAAAAATKPTPAPAPPPAKPHAGTPAKPVDPVSEAQKYIYGKRVPQDCERGLRILKPAADQGNPKAMVEMGALYSAGLCTPRDLPTSYRWFALALRKDPSNQPLQADLEKLWSEMTQPERQLAIKLSQ